ncbi:regulatory protein RecX [Treponema sp.]|uniref:regulatory protein RecX n=1 Tax=Treponema sp. TaxID=166 RepID=UPI00388F7CB7
MDENVRLAVEAAARSLARAEQCRAGLEKKLLQKEFDSNTIAQALDFLEEKGYLSDERYSSSWIRTHCSFRQYGKARLLKELISRGVKKSIAENAIEEYFISNSEEDFCRKALLKLLAQKKDKQKIFRSLVSAGFSYSIIQRVFKNNEVSEFGPE